MTNITFKVCAQFTDTRNGKSIKRSRSYEHNTFADAHDTANWIKNGTPVDGISIDHLFISREEVILVVTA